MAIQLLGLYTSTAEGTGSIPGQVTKIPHTVPSSQKKKKIKAASSVWTLTVS